MNSSASSTGISSSPESKPHRTYPTIKELQAEFQEKNPDMYFDMARDPGDPVELVFCGKLPCDKGGDAWSEFLKEHADKFLKEAGMYSKRMCDNLSIWVRKFIRETYWRYYYKIAHLNKLWYTNVVRILTDTTERGLRIQDWYRERARKELAGEKDYATLDEDDKEDEGVSDEDSDEDSDDDSDDDPEIEEVEDSEPEPEPVKVKSRKPKAEKEVVIIG